MGLTLISEEIMAKNFLTWQSHKPKDPRSSEKLKQNEPKEIHAQTHQNQTTEN